MLNGNGPSYQRMAADKENIRMKGLIAKKVGMTQVFDEQGNLTPVTVISVEPNTVVSIKTKENCGYE